MPGFYPADLSSAWYRPPHIHFLIMATGYDELVTQMYFRGDKISENDWIQDLNEKDFLLRNPNLTKEQRDQLVVEFNEDAQGVYRDGFVGQFNIQLK